MSQRKRYSPREILGYLRQSEEGIPDKELCEQHGFCLASLRKWRDRYGGLQFTQPTPPTRSTQTAQSAQTAQPKQPAQLNRLHELESENAMLKRLLTAAYLKLHVEP